jgi:hypothetical protein
MRTRLRFRILAVCALATAAVAMSAITGAAPALAANGCSGQLLQTKGIYAGSTRIGEVQAYWNSTTKRNCAATVHGGPTWGVRLRTQVYAYNGHYVGWGDRFTFQSYYYDDAYGDYAYYAGPASPNVDATNLCFEATGRIFWNGTPHETTIGPNWCGTI